MLEEKLIVIDDSISKKDSGKKFKIYQLSALKIKKLGFAYQDVFNLGDLNKGDINIDKDKMENLYFSVLSNVCYIAKDSGTEVRLTEAMIEGIIEDIDTMDYLVNEFWKFNLGEDTSPTQKFLTSLTRMLD